MAVHRTPLGRARGLGAAKHGVGHWISQRLTAIALAPLVIWGIGAALTLGRGGYQDALVWLRSPLNAVLMTLTAAIAFWHMHAGMRVVIEDYIHKPGSKAALLILNLGVCALVGVLAVFCLLKVALGGGVS